MNETSEPFVHMAIKIARDASEDEMSEEQALLYGSDILERAYDVGMYTVHQKSNIDSTYMIEKLVSLEEELRAKANLCMFLPPMLVKPLKWQNDVGEDYKGGYLTHKTSIILGHDNDNVYQPTEDINAIQEVSYKIDMNLMPYLDEYKWDSPEEAMAFRFILTKVINPELDIFYFVNRYDFRGRIYTSGWAINPQGDDFHKSILDFGEGEYMAEEDEVWVKRAIANAYGMDKKTWAVRDAWFNRRHNKTDRANKDVSKLLKLRHEASDPWMYLKLVLAWQDHLNGKKIHAPIRYDATTSFAHVYAVLSGSKDLAKISNLVNDDDKRNDLYSMVTSDVNARLAGKSELVRIVVKRGLMVNFYSAGDETQRKRMENERGKALTDFEFLCYNQAKNSLAPDALVVMDDLVLLRNKRNKTTSWYTPDNFYVEMKHYKTIKVRVTVPNVGKLTIQYNKHQAVDMDKGISPNAVHSYDGTAVRYIIRKSNGKPVATTHDEYGRLPSGIKVMMVHYLEFFCELNDMPLLEELYSSIACRPIKVDRKSTLYNSDIMKSKYALC